MTEPSRIPGFRGEFLWELDIVARQMLALAKAIPPEKYGWKPDVSARSVSEIFVHVATGNFMLLDIAGRPVPGELCSPLPAEGKERFTALMRWADGLATQLREKMEVSNLLRSSLDAVATAMRETSDSDLERGLFFFWEQTTLRRLYLRLLVHNHEHMGQMIAYIRCNGLSVPWSDWRPDRRRPS